MPVAFGVRKDYEDKWEPGSIAVGDSSVDLADMLQQGKGQIVVADDQHVLLSKLDEQMALKREPVRPVVEDKKAKPGKEVSA